MPLEYSTCLLQIITLHSPAQYSNIMLHSLPSSLFDSRLPTSLVWTGLPNVCA